MLNYFGAFRDTLDIWTNKIFAALDVQIPIILLSILKLVYGGISSVLLPKKHILKKCFSKLAEENFKNT